MMALITPSEQRPLTTEAEKAEALQKLIAYSGIYRLEPPNRFVTQVDIAWFQPWVGSEQGRNFSLKGNILEIVSDPVRSPHDEDSPVIGVLSWIRESAPHP
jgi:Lipocalin-like domain